MEEIIELVDKAQSKYKTKFIQITFWKHIANQISGEIYDFDKDVSVHKFNSIEELRTHLNESQYEQN